MIYGYVYMSVFVETGTTERGAKIAASRVDSEGTKARVVGYRSPINNMFIATARKFNGKWEMSQ